MPGLRPSTPQGKRDGCWSRHHPDSRTAGDGLELGGGEQGRRAVAVGGPWVGGLRCRRKAMGCLPLLRVRVLPCPWKWALGGTLSEKMT